MKASDYSELMPVEVFVGGCGDLVLCQEWPQIEGEQYLRIIVPMRDALKLAHKIIAVAELQNRNNR
jgi:hypothetical protein